MELFGVDLLRRGDNSPTSTSDGGFFAEATSKIGGAAQTATAAAAQATKCSKKHDDDDDGGLIGWAEGELHDAKCDIENELGSFKNWMEDEIKDGINSLAQILGVHDFYSAHIMNFCEGYYVPGPMPNATVEKGSIYRNVTECSNKTAMYHFNPTNTLSKELNESTNGLVDLSKIHWPDEVHDGLNALRMAQRAMFVLYCIAIGFIFLAMAFAAGSLFTSRRLVAAINFVMDLLAFLAIMVSSAIVTFIARKSTHIINEYGDNIGISANQGNKFLALTWATTGLVFISMLVWLVDFFRGKSDRSRYRHEPKYG